MIPCNFQINNTADFVMFVHSMMNSNRLLYVNTTHTSFPVNIGTFKHRRPIFEWALPMNLYDYALPYVNAVQTICSYCNWLINRKRQWCGWRGEGGHKGHSRSGRATAAHVQIFLFNFNTKLVTSFKTGINTGLVVGLTDHKIQEQLIKICQFLGLVTKGL